MKLDSTAKKRELDVVFGDWEGQDQLTDFIFDAALRAFQHWIKPGKILELGMGAGTFTRKLLPVFESVDSVEGSAVLCSRLHERHYHNHTIIHSLFEEFRPEKKIHGRIVFFCQ